MHRHRHLFGWQRRFLSLPLAALLYGLVRAVRLRHAPVVISVRPSGVGLVIPAKTWSFRPATLTWKNSIAESIQNVMSAYFDMDYAMKDMQVREDAIAADTKLVDISRRRVELGFGSPLEGCPGCRAMNA